MLILPATSAVDPGAVLRARLTGFAGFLRANGYGVGSADSIRVLETSVQTGILDQQVLRWSLTSEGRAYAEQLDRDRADLARRSEAFDFWRELLEDPTK